jgi:dienelactone hydrolase
MHMSVHLNRYQHFTSVMRDPAIECVVSRYRSSFDQSRQSLLVMRPVVRSQGDLFIFFHGMDGDCGDGVVMRQLVSRLGGTVVALGGRGPAWVSDAFLFDAAQVVHEHAADSERVYFVGISMGGTQALTLAAELGGMRGLNLAGVISFIPGADLVDSANCSVNGRVRATLCASVAGDLRKLQERSPIALVSKYRPGLPFVIAYNEADTILNAARTTDFVKLLRGRGLPSVAYAIPGDHSFVTEQLDERIDYRRVLEDLGKTSATAWPVPTLRLAARPGHHSEGLRRVF